jgi:chromosome segregation ATPase
MAARKDDITAEQARLAARVRELERQLRRERSRNEGLERGLSALSERVTSLRQESHSERLAVARGR